VALSYLDSTVKAIKIDGVEPNEENIVNGQYPVWAYEHMYTLGTPTDAKKAFLDHMLTDEVQNNLVSELGFIQIGKMKVERDSKGNITQK